MIQPEYRTLSEYPDYSVGSDGSVRSHKYGKVRHLKTRKGRDDAVKLYHDGRLVQVDVPFLVAQAFLGPRPDGHFVSHKHDIRDNRVENLFYGTKAEYLQRRRHRGTLAKGERCGASKLTESRVRAIREASSRGLSRAEIAATHGVTVWTVRDILLGRTWRDVK